MARLSIVGQDFSPVSHDSAASVRGKEQVGYVQVEAFRNERYGYSCGTCDALHTVMSVNGFCGRIEALTGVANVPVTTYGCCNGWKLSDSWLTYGGQ